MKKLLFIVLFLFITFSLHAETSINPESLRLNEEGVQAAQNKDFAEAEDLFLEALTADEFNLTAVYNLAGMYLTNEENEDAIKLLKAYTKKYPSDPGLTSRLADAYFSTQNITKAETYYLKTIELDKSYPNIYGRLGTIYTLKSKLADAEKLFLKATQAEPLNYDYLASLSSLQLGNGNAQDAIRTAKKALQVEATSEVYVTLGTAYEETKNYSNALIAFQRAQDLGDIRQKLSDKIKELKELNK